MPKRKLYKCRHCAYESSERVDKWQHIKTHLKPEKLLACQACPFVTEYRHHYEYHQRNHTGDKPFQCDKCQYRCVNKSMLKSHSKSHSSECPFRCNQCAYTTKYTHSLKMHLQKYHQMYRDETPQKSGILVETVCSAQLTPPPSACREHPDDPNHMNNLRKTHINNALSATTLATHQQDILDLRVKAKVKIER